MADMEMNTTGLDELAGELMGGDDDLGAMFGSDFEEIEAEAQLSQDLEGFANGFPSWDLHPPKK